MALRLLKLVNKWFALAAFWSYLGAAAIAFTMVIVFFPVGALALLLVALLSLPVVVVFSTGMGWWERAWCRRWLRAARCPRCLQYDAVRHLAGSPTAPGTGPGASFGPDRTPQVEPWRRIEAPSYECLRCGAFFDASGAETEVPLTA